MSRFILLLSLLTIALAAGCASVAPQTSEVASAAAPSAAATTSPRVLKAEEFDFDYITCQDMLKSGSNVIVTRCMTQSDWKVFKRAQELQAQQLLRTWQGSSYRY